MFSAASHFGIGNMIHDTTASSVFSFSFEAYGRTGGYFASIFRPPNFFFSGLKKVPKKGKHAAMQDSARGIHFFFYRLHISIFVRHFRLSSAVFGSIYTYPWEERVSYDICYGTMSTISLTTADRWLDVSFVFGLD